MLSGGAQVHADAGPAMPNIKNVRRRDVASVFITTSTHEWKG
jgi:hypothetical protein